MASDAALDDRFGWAVAVSGDKAIVGAYQNNDFGYNSGSAYVFEWNGIATGVNGNLLLRSKSQLFPNPTKGLFTIHLK